MFKLRNKLLAGSYLAAVALAGLSDYSAQSALNWETGSASFPVLASRFMALFTAAPTSDAGTGGTEVSGGSYARVQVAGALTLAASFTTASTTLTLASTVPAWLLALGTNGSGCNAYDATNGQQIGTVSGISGTTVTLTGTAAHASSGAADSIVFSAFPPATASSGAEPATVPATVSNAAAISFATATASWGTVLAWGLYDAATSGNLISWDYLGNFKWNPFTGSSATPGVLTSPAHGYANGDPVVVSAKFGGVLPATGGSWASALTVAGSTTDTFTAGVNTTGTGDGSVRKIIQQSIPSGVTASFVAANMTLTMA